MQPTRGLAAFPRSSQAETIGTADHRAPTPHQTHPGPARATLPGHIRDAIVAHALAELPNEACGLIAGTAIAAEGGAATRWHPARNGAASPDRYEIRPDDLLRITLAIDDAGEVAWGIAHSHVRSPARPSATDVGRAIDPEALYVIVSLADGEADPGTGAAADPGTGAAADPGTGAAADPGTGAGPATGGGVVRAWRIVDGAVFEVALEVGAG